MKKLIPFLLGSVLVVGAAGCQNAAKTSADAPNNTSESPSAPSVQTTQTNQNDAQSQVRKNQLNSDIRANEQRNNATGGGTNRTGNALASEVRDKLEANIPDSQLAVQAKNGVVTVAGTVANKQDLGKIVPEAQKIKGVKNVVNKASVAPPKAKS
jgi:osmotically-inducible protein OsmY